MELQKVQGWVDLCFKAMSIAAIIAAGLWAYYQYLLTDNESLNTQLAVTTEVLKYSDVNRLLVIHMRPKNIGKARVIPNQLIVTVKDLPSNLEPGPVDLGNIKERYQADILEKYKGGYSMEPGIDYDEVVTMIVPKGMYSVRGEMGFEEDYAVDHMIIARVE